MSMMHLAMHLARGGAATPRLGDATKLLGDGPRTEQRSTRAAAAGVAVSVGGDRDGGEHKCIMLRRPCA